MYPKNYEDYKEDEPLIQHPVSSGKGIVGAEMHEINGWGLKFHQKKKKAGFLTRLFKGEIIRRKKEP